MTKALEIIHFCKSFGKSIAVDNLSLSVETGELFGLLGPNGAGKSTTINCICGINQFHEGQISVYGFDVVKSPVEAKKLIGLSPQDYNVDIHLTLRQILNFCGGYYSIPRSKRIKIIDDLVQLLDLKKHQHKKFKELSGGMKRRVMLARAMICNPELLILDEPTAALDVELRYELWEHILKLNKAGKTIILTSHYIEEIEKLCRRVAIMNKGKLLFIGPVTELLKNHRNLEHAYMQMIKQNEN